MDDHDDFPEDAFDGLDQESEPGDGCPDEWDSLHALRDGDKQAIGEAMLRRADAMRDRMKEGER